jgi:multiple sugar transport system permease protein
MEREASASLLQRTRTSKFRESLAGYLMQSPALLVLTAFVLIPMAAAIFLAFTKYNLFDPPKWNGIANFQHLFSDKRLWRTYENTVLIALGSVVGNNVLGLLLAMGVNRAMSRTFKYFLRAALFFPVLTTAASLAMVWRYIFATDRGAMNWVLGQLGIGRIAWLTSSEWALFSVIMYQVWRSLGVTMVVYLAGLQGIPQELYEAAKIDGAGSWQLTRHITLPLITPSAFFNVVMGFIAGFQIFEGSYVLTGGGPGDASRTIAVYLYELAFRRFEMGYGATVSVTLLVLLMLLTVLQFWIGNRWVYYE